ncbi:MAG: FAD-dependent oxidoreductase [Oscillochloris sp.]|nr:FAD-dependent oxidoreductase [Oscillochloris sp.]
MATYDCVVIGAGISGLSAAYTLYKRGLAVLVVEPANGSAALSIASDAGRLCA